MRSAGTGAALILFRRELWVLAVAAIISGCGTTVQSPSYYPPVTFRPAAAAPSGPSHIVRASWYGPGFNGRRTTSGEVFSEHSLTAASKTLPLGSRVRVTNLSTGRSVVVKVNDRGPFVRGRSLDLSEAAARRIGIAHAGVAKVKVTRLNANRGRIEPMSATVPPHNGTGVGASSKPSYRTWLGRLASFSSGQGNRERSGRRRYATEISSWVARWSDNLKALGLNPKSLQAVQQEHTQVLPGLSFNSDDQTLHRQSGHMNESAYRVAAHRYSPATLPDCGSASGGSKRLRLMSEPGYSHPVVVANVVRARCTSMAALCQPWPNSASGHLSAANTVRV